MALFIFGVPWPLEKLTNQAREGLGEPDIERFGHGIESPLPRQRPTTITGTPKRGFKDLNDDYHIYSPKGTERLKAVQSQRIPVDTPVWV